jgi:hypothetical protein
MLSRCKHLERKREEKQELLLLCCLRMCALKYDMKIIFFYSHRKGKRRKFVSQIDGAENQ